jgi:hypothetical protein
MIAPRSARPLVDVPGLTVLVAFGGATVGDWMGAALGAVVAVGGWIGIAVVVGTDVTGADAAVLSAGIGGTDVGVGTVQPARIHAIKAMSNRLKRCIIVLWLLNVMLHRVKLFLRDLAFGVARLQDVEHGLA